MALDLVAAFVDAFNAEMRHLATLAERESVAAKQTLTEVERKLTAIVCAIEDGAYTPTLKRALRRWSRRRRRWKRGSAPASQPPRAAAPSQSFELCCNKIDSPHSRRSRPRHRG